MKSLSESLIPKGIIFGILAALSFSLMALFVKLAKGVPTQEVILARSVFTLIASFLVLKCQGRSLFGQKENRWLLLLRGFAGYLALSAYFFSILKLPLGVASLIQYLSPIFSAILAYLFLKEGSSVSQIVSLGAGLLGIAFVSELLPFGLFNSHLNSFGATPIYWVACLTSAILSGVAYSAVRQLNLKGEHSDVIIFYFPLVSFPLSLIACLGHWVLPTWQQAVYVFLACAFSYAGQQFLTFSLRSQSTAAATNTLYLGALFASSWGFLFLGEHPTIGFGIGAFLVIGSQIWLRGRVAKKI